MTHHPSVDYQNHLTTQQLTMTIQNLQQQLILQQQDHQVLMTDMKILMQKLSEKTTSTSMINHCTWLMLQQIERSFTYVLLQKMGHQLVYILKSFI